jgi:hypothetical protein
MMSFRTITPMICVLAVGLVAAGSALATGYDGLHYHACANLHHPAQVSDITVKPGTSCKTADQLIDDFATHPLQSATTIPFRGRQWYYSLSANRRALSLSATAHQRFPNVYALFASGGD